MDNNNYVSGLSKSLLAASRAIMEGKAAPAAPETITESVEEIQELSKKTLKSYTKKATTSADRAWAKADKEEDKSMATDGEKYPEKQARHQDNANKAIGTWRKRDSGLATAKKKLGEEIEELEIYNEFLGVGRILDITESTVEVMFENEIMTFDLDTVEFAEEAAAFYVEDFADEEVELEEGLGSLAGLPKHLVKSVVSAKGQYNSKTRGGENSPITSHGVATSHHALKKAINASLDSGGHTVLYHNGSPVGAIHNDDSYGKPTYAMHDDKGAAPAKKSRTVPGTGKYDHRSGKYIAPKFHPYEENSHTKGEAVDKAIHNILGNRAGVADMTDKTAYKAHNFEVRNIGKDASRAEKAAGRTVARKREDTLGPIRDKAIDKYAVNHLSSDNSPHEQAKNLHAQIGDAIEKGEHLKVHTLAGALQDHVKKHGVGKTSHDAKSFKDSLKTLRNGPDYMKDYARRDIANKKDAGTIK